MFEKGQKVLLKKNGTDWAIGTVISISPKRGDITVKFPNYKSTFMSNGFERCKEPYFCGRIIPLTPEKAKEIEHLARVLKCRDLYDEVNEKLEDLCDDQLDKLISVLEYLNAVKV